MRLGSNRDGDDGDARSGRRRHYRAESHDWYAEDDVAPYEVPRRPRIDEVQRSDDRTSRGHGRSSRSLDASQSTMPPPPPRLVRSSTDAYRRPAHIVVYEEDDTSEGWRQERRRAPSPEYRRPGRPREHREPSPISIEGPEDYAVDDRNGTVTAILVGMNILALPGVDGVARAIGCRLRRPKRRRRKWARKFAIDIHRQSEGRQFVGLS
ncbi:Fc.00g089920.m01.CDS01 [Cosmosporella sp. VM-42]